MNKNDSSLLLIGVEKIKKIKKNLKKIWSIIDI